MLKKIFSTLFKSGKKATESVGQSMDFIDDLLEKEHIANAVESIKESTGNVVEKAGTIYQKTKDTIDDNFNMDNLKDKVDTLVEKGKEATSDLADSMQEKTDTMKNVYKEGEDFVKGVLDDGEQE